MVTPAAACAPCGDAPLRDVLALAAREIEATLAGAPDEVAVPACSIYLYNEGSSAANVRIRQIATVA